MLTRLSPNINVTWIARGRFGAEMHYFASGKFAISESTVVGSGTGLRPVNASISLNVFRRMFTTSAKMTAAVSLRT